MKHNLKASYLNVCLRPLDKNDIENLRVWRNDKDATKYLRQIPYITPEMQAKWYENYLTQNDQITFAIDETNTLNKMVGSVSLYDITDTQAEFGRIQIGEKEAHGKGIGKLATIIILYIGFCKLNLTKIIATVNKQNAPACKIYFNVGFKIVGEHSTPNGDEYDIEIDFSTLKEKYQDILDKIVL